MAVFQTPAWHSHKPDDVQFVYRVIDRQTAGLRLCGMVVDPTGGVLVESHNSLPEPDVSHGCDVSNSGS
ncbi:hypothetical protein [Rahnella aceris]|uniref:hypothetical protein n=1 Tax=Rahnella sp. (strain Y9602) TaxID=2703885 RepID=UPI0002E14D5D|nr:hypothetical protein [Rahnella aceris]